MKVPVGVTEPDLWSRVGAWVDKRLKYPYLVAAVMAMAMLLRTGNAVYGSLAVLLILAKISLVICSACLVPVLRPRRRQFLQGEGFEHVRLHGANRFKATYEGKPVHGSFRFGSLAPSRSERSTDRYQTVVFIQT